MRAFGITLVVIIASVVVTSLVVRATEYVSSRGLTANVHSISTMCKRGMTYVPTEQGGFCIDIFERSAGSRCVYDTPENSIQTGQNIQIMECESESVRGRIPWVNVTRVQALQLCAKSGLRLPSSREWYYASLGTEDILHEPVSSGCNLYTNWGDGIGLTGSGEKCVSSFGVHDMAGNVWEWVADDVVANSVDGIQLPQSGYVDGVTSAGFPFISSTSPNTLYGNDYFWASKLPLTAVMRGGFYGSGEDGGVFSMNIEVLPTFSSSGVGFRCAF